ncbi:RnfABCDGE type electron transport complex subunit G [Pseudomonas sp. Teo4]|uniref:RnfABCDGE type electron transport complex subunit G n=1 Tax=Pseudomonas sp. Teo4 TaxID=3064528 RepID=UPI002AB9832A|nr:RnfABCDGE type electron transport complex subunit G [Pseudomonas sp. Teo4]MDZ3995785.1 Ion-translocating oxidoreductase complex subunit G [Pseudomonas sp. Teo4]
MKHLIRSAGWLIAVGILSLSATFAWRQWTHPAISQAEQALKERQWLAVLPANSYDNRPLAVALPVPDAKLPHSRVMAAYLAMLGTQVTAVILLSETQGYGGPIRLTIAIDPNGRLIGSQVLEQQESPGLGARIGDPQLNWLGQFANRHLKDHWALKRDQGDFDQLAGATVTSRAVIEALQDALSYFDAHRQVLLEAPVHE